MHILDSQISRALVQPTPWEVAQWRAAALKDKAAWSALIDIGSSHRFCDDVQRSVDTEIRRERMWCGPAPCVTAAAPVPTELARNEYYQARNLWSWMRAEYRAESGGKVTAFGDKVALISEGAVAPNARSVSAAHSFAQGSAPNQVAAIAPYAALANREAALFTSAQFYDSSLSAASWAFCHNGSSVDIITVFCATATSNSTYWATQSGASAQSGTQMLVSGGTTYYQVFKPGASLFFAGAAGAGTVGVANYVENYYSESLSPKYGTYSKTVLSSSGNTGQSPSAADPDGPFRIGASQGVGAANKSATAIAEIMIANRFDTTVRTAQRRNLLLRYSLS